MIIIYSEINNRHYGVGVCTDEAALKLAFRVHKIDEISSDEFLEPKTDWGYDPNMPLAYVATRIWYIHQEEIGEDGKWPEGSVSIGMGAVAYEIPNDTTYVHGYSES